jgi:hypothetical protein
LSYIIQKKPLHTHTHTHTHSYFKKSHVICIRKKEEVELHSFLTSASDRDERSDSQYNTLSPKKFLW